MVEKQGPNCLVVSLGKWRRNWGQPQKSRARKGELVEAAPCDLTKFSTTGQKAQQANEKLCGLSKEKTNIQRSELSLPQRGAVHTILQAQQKEQGTSYPKLPIQLSHLSPCILTTQW